MINSIHPIVYKCNDFIYYIEEWKGLNVIHITIKRFSHNIFKKMCRVLKKLQKAYGTNLYGYGLEDSTYKLMKPAGFEETEHYMTTTTNKTLRLMICPLQ